MLARMASPSGFPAQTLAVLAALYEQPTYWQDGSALARQTGVTPEQLHAIVSQLAAGGLAQIAQPGTARPGASRPGATRPGATRASQPAGAHYRLTAEGLASAVMVLAAAAQLTTVSRL
jgi:transposase-like protein